MAECKTCFNSGKRGWVKRSYPAPPGVIYGFAPYWPCPTCNGNHTESCCEGAVGGPEEITNQGENR